MLNQCSRRRLSGHSPWRVSSEEQSMVLSGWDTCSVEHIKDSQKSHERETCWLLFKLSQFYLSKSSPLVTLVTTVSPPPPPALLKTLESFTSTGPRSQQCPTQNTDAGWKFQKCATGTCELLQKASHLGRHCCPLRAFSKIPFIHIVECGTGHLEDFKGPVISQLQGM